MKPALRSPDSTRPGAEPAGGAGQEDGAAGRAHGRKSSLEMWRLFHRDHDPTFRAMSRSHNLFVMAAALLVACGGSTPATTPAPAPEPASLRQTLPRPAPP